jgi:hypothetical protein
VSARQHRKLFDRMGTSGDLDAVVARFVPATAGHDRRVPVPRSRCRHAWLHLRPMARPGSPIFRRPVEGPEIADGRDRAVLARPRIAAQSGPGLSLSKSTSSKCRLTTPPPGRPCDGSPGQAPCPAGQFADNPEFVAGAGPTRDQRIGERHPLRPHPAQAIRRSASQRARPATAGQVDRASDRTLPDNRVATRAIREAIWRRDIG